MDKALSVLVSFLVVVFTYYLAPPGFFLPIALYLLLPLTLIWFGGELASWAGPTGRNYVGGPSPTVFVKKLGWGLFLLIAPVLALMILWRL